MVMLNCNENVKMQYILIFLKLNFIYGLQNVIFFSDFGQKYLEWFHDFNPESVFNYYVFYIMICIL